LKLQHDMTQKLRISKPTFNVLTETNLDNIIYDSEYDTLKYYSSGLLSIVVDEPATGNPGTNYSHITYVEHNLEYYPFYQVFVEYDGSGIYRMNGAVSITGTFQFGTARHKVMFSWITSNRLYVRVFGRAQLADSYTANFRYKIFRNDLGY